jgi:ferric-dicitrate binding protein FerR (iron transport regulator)
LNINESEDHKEQLFMNPGELVEFDKVSAKYSKRKVNPDTHSSWKVKKMVFENTSLSEIKYMLENTYGLEVQISDPALLEQKLNGSIPNENVDVLLDGLSHLFNLKITKANNLVTIDSE